MASKLSLSSKTQRSLFNSIAVQSESNTKCLKTKAGLSIKKKPLITNQQLIKQFNPILFNCLSKSILINTLKGQFPIIQNKNVFFKNLNNRIKKPIIGKPNKILPDLHTLAMI